MHTRSCTLLMYHHVQMDNDGTLMEDNSDDSSSSASGEADDGASAMDVESAAPAQPAPKERVVDDDGFELVQSRRRR